MGSPACYTSPESVERGLLLHQLTSTIWMSQNEIAFGSAAADATGPTKRTCIQTSEAGGIGSNQQSDVPTHLRLAF